MKKVALVSLALLLAPQLVEAQTAGGTVSATATVLTSLTVTNVSDLNFGSLAGGVGATITPGVVPGGAGQSLGELEVTHNSGFSVAVTPPANLIHTLYPAEAIATTFNCGYATTSGGTVSLVESCSVMSNRTHPTNDGSSQTTYLQVGGDIATTAGAVPGVYSGDLVFTLTAVY